MPDRFTLTDDAFDSIVTAVREHTHALLGLTIGYSEDQWATPSRLPGWSLSHVAAHLAGGAEAMCRIIDGLQSSHQARMYVSDLDKALDIERRALLPGMEMQVLLDETSSQLDARLPSLLGDQRLVQVRAGYRMPAYQLPLARLYELVLHTFDMRTEDTHLPVASHTAKALLAFICHRIGDSPTLPPVEVVADEGFEARIGGDGEEIHRVSGPARDILMWLARDIASPQLHGAFPVD